MTKVHFFYSNHEYLNVGAPGDQRPIQLKPLPPSLSFVYQSIENAAKSE
jgi:hypothetical protein